MWRGGREYVLMFSLFLSIILKLSLHSTPHRSLLTQINLCQHLSALVSTLTISTILLTICIGVCLHTTTHYKVCLNGQATFSQPLLFTQYHGQLLVRQRLLELPVSNQDCITSAIEPCPSVLVPEVPPQYLLTERMKSIYLWPPC